MVWIVDIIFRVLRLVKILLDVYKVSTNYMTLTHISVNRKYRNVISSSYIRQMIMFSKNKILKMKFSKKNKA